MQPARILVVEDENIVALDIHDRLTTLGYAVAGTASRGEEAVALADSSRPDLVLMDIHLQGAMDGIAAADLIRKRWRIPIVFLTAYSEDATLERAKRTEPFGYILKPFEDREIHSIIAMALYKHAAEERLRQSERRYATTLNSIGDGVIATDPTGRITFLNPVAEAITGWPMAQALGRPLADVFRIINEQSRQPVEDPVARVLREKAVVTLANHTILIARDGREIPIDDGAAPIFDDAGAIAGTVLVFQDVTERRQKEIALRDSQTRNRQIVETAHEGIWCIDAQSRTSFVNKRMEEILGYKEGEMLGRPLSEFLMPESVADHEVQMQSRSRGRPGHFERPYRHASGEWVWMSVSATPQFDESGRFLGSFAMFTDITARKRAEEERLAMERRLLHSQKLESLGVLAGGIAHDFNNLLTVILGNLELAMMDLPNPSSPARESLREATQATRRAADLTRQMLAYSGRGKFLIQEVDLSELLGEMSQLLKASVSKNVTLQFRSEAPTPKIHADAAQLQQIAMNLVTNASEAIGDHLGSITVCTGVRDWDAASLASSRLEEKPPPGRYVSLEVSDTGCGMEERVQQRLFEPFFTTKFTGRGLGMSAVLGVIRGHKGAIMVTSQPNCGSTIRVLFPVGAPAEAVTDALASPAPTHSASTANSGAVLVVDDEKLVLRLAVRMLERAGLRVLGAANGEEAIRIFQTEAANLSCVVMDLTMPGIDGIQASAELRRIRPDIPILLASGFDEHELSQRFAGQGLAGFIQKPYGVDNLAQPVLRLCQKRPS
jgi:PAS domain S-box-containing protein